MFTKEFNDLRIAKDWLATEDYLLKYLIDYPTSPEGWFCLSESYVAQNRPEEALGAASKAIGFDPGKYQAWAFLANAHALTGNWAGVFQAATRAMSLAPDLPQAHWLLGHCAMAANEWGEAWKHLEYGVLANLRKYRAVQSKAWNGQDVKGKTLFVWCEQGAGDAIQYARFLPLLKERTGAGILFECRTGLVNLLSPLADMTIAEQPDNSTTFGYDYHLPIMEIPRMLDLDTKDISGKPYLFTEGVRPDAEGKIGLCYKGFEGHGNDHNRSIPDELVKEFKDIKNLVGILPGTETPKWLPNLPVTDFLSTAQILKSLKCLVTVDTSTAHVAGALGVKTIMIAPILNTEARWASGTSTPWYDSVTIVHGKTFSESIIKAKELLNGI
jgi:tetratricopeptide (TPR) repeat protein